MPLSVMAPDAELSRASSGDVQRAFLRTQVHLQPEGAEIAELLAAGVAAHTILNLYPLDVSQLAARIRAQLATAKDVRRFMVKLAPIEDRGLDLIYDKLAGAASYRMLENMRFEFSKNLSYELLRADARITKVRSNQRSSAADNIMREAMVSAADMLWIAANWHLLPPLSGLEARFCTLMLRLDEALGIKPVKKRRPRA